MKLIAFIYLQQFAYCKVRFINKWVVKITVNTALPVYYNCIFPLLRKLSL